MVVSRAVPLPPLYPRVWLAEVFEFGAYTASDVPMAVTGGSRPSIWPLVPLPRISCPDSCSCSAWCRSCQIISSR